jgi:ubiquinone/menaquinone biosynthesis C-methylase UbiE
MKGHPFFARIYDRAFESCERAGLSDMRRALLAGAAGRTLEIGAGTGLNLSHYTDAVTELVLAEPDPHMAEKLREKLEDQETPAPKVEVISAPAEELPFDEGSFDTVVSTLVFCTVDDAIEAIAEAKRVLVPGGKLLFLEHVRGEPRRARWQDRLERPWGWIAGGCHPNRATGDLLAASGLRIEQMENDTLDKAGPLIRPLIRGVAIRP